MQSQYRALQYSASVKKSRLKYEIKCDLHKISSKYKRNLNFGPAFFEVIFQPWYYCCVQIQLSMWLIFIYTVTYRPINWECKSHDAQSEHLIIMQDSLLHKMQSRLHCIVCHQSRPGVGKLFSPWVAQKIHKSVVGRIQGQIQDLDFGEGEARWKNGGALEYMMDMGRGCPLLIGEGPGDSPEVFFIFRFRSAYFGALFGPSECLLLRCNTSRPPVRLPSLTFQADCGAIKSTGFPAEESTEHYLPWQWVNWIWQICNHWQRWNTMSRRLKTLTAILQTGMSLTAWPLGPSGSQCQKS